MKIQYLAVLFIVIILPISMVISYYVNAQINTINAQELYDTKLVTATYDSVRSFQLNTINNKYSSVSDSKMRDIEAGVSSFFNSLGTELGATGYSREDLSTFIPAILYSMYDGYYIYGEYYDEALGDYRIGLKPYVFYSCRYVKGNNDFTVNYTLDNTISIYGKVGTENVAVTGALINYKDITLSSNPENTYKFLTRHGVVEERKIANQLSYKGVEIKPEILSENIIVLNNQGDPIPDNNQAYPYEYIVYNDQKIYVDKDANGDVALYDLTGTNYTNGEAFFYDDGTEYQGIMYFTLEKNKKQYRKDKEIMALLNELVYIDSDGHTHLHSNSACQYYYDAYKFSKWVDEKLGNSITQEDAVDKNNKKITDFETNLGSAYLFNLDSNIQGEDPMLESSTFNQQRMNVIKRSIKTNLSAEMANYGAKTGYDYRMPELTYEDWDKILNDVCVTTFMQGISIGMKYYNNYCVVSNDKNKEVVTLDSIYIIESDDGVFDYNDEIHYPGCEEIINSTKNMIGYRNIDFERQTVVGTLADYYFYPHDNQKSYNCMVNAKSSYDLESIITGDKYEFDGEKMVKTGKIGDKLRQAYLTALGREKYDLYRTNGYFGLPE